MDKPPATPDLEILGAKVAALFETAFTSKNPAFRPKAKSWIDALVKLEQQTVQCALNKSHWHLRDLSSCPWCKMESMTGTPLFPFVIQGFSSATGIDVGDIAKQLLSLPKLGATPTIVKPVVKASDAAFEVRKERRKWQAACVALVVVSILAGVMLTSWLLTLGLLGVSFVTCSALSAHDKSLKILHLEFEKADQQRRFTETEWQRLTDGSTFEQKLSAFFSAKPDWDRLPQERSRRLSQLQTDRRRLQFESHLDSVYIENSKISGVGRGRKDILSSEGIETALDVVEQRLTNIPSFGPVTVSHLLAWRLSVEQSFIFDDSKGVDPKDIAAIEQAVVAERTKVEGRLKTLSDQAFQEHARASSVRVTYRPRVEAAAAKFAQAEANLQVAR